MTEESWASTCKRVRAEKHLSVREAAQRAGVNEKTWQRWEAGSNCPRYSQIGVLTLLKAYPTSTSDKMSSVKPTSDKLSVSAIANEAWKASRPITPEAVQHRLQPPIRSGLPLFKPSGKLT